MIRLIIITDPSYYETVHHFTKNGRYPSHTVIFVHKAFTMPTHSPQWMSNSSSLHKKNALRQSILQLFLSYKSYHLHSPSIDYEYLLLAWEVQLPQLCKVMAPFTGHEFLAYVPRMRVVGALHIYGQSLMINMLLGTRYDKSECCNTALCCK